MSLKRSDAASKDLIQSRYKIMLLEILHTPTTGPMDMKWLQAYFEVFLYNDSTYRLICNTNLRI